MGVAGATPMVTWGLRGFSPVLKYTAGPRGGSPRGQSRRLCPIKIGRVVRET